jgi:hypothetical protein
MPPSAARLIALHARFVARLGDPWHASPAAPAFLNNPMAPPSVQPPCQV